MSKIAIVTDSTVCLPEELNREYDITVVPTRIRKGNVTFKDGVEVTAAQVYQWLREGERLYTSQPSVGEFQEVFRRLAKTAEAIVSIHPTSDLSGVYNSAVGAAKLMEGFPIEIIDTRTLSMAHGLVVLAAARAARDGASLSEVVEKAKALVPRVTLLAVLESLEYAHRSGRIPAVTAIIGSLLNISPVLEAKDGKIEMLARVRTKKKAVAWLLEEMERRVGKGPIHAAVLHADAWEEAQALRDEVASRFHCLELHFTDIPAVLGVHAGPGALGVAFYAE